jgi:hypothetical protein
MHVDRILLMKNHISSLLDLIYTDRSLRADIRSLRADIRSHRADRRSLRADRRSLRADIRSLRADIRSPKLIPVYIHVIAGTFWWYSVWIGAEDIGDNDFFWSENKRRIDFSYWRSTEPSLHADENCVELYSDGTWNDLECSHSRWFVCETNI